MRYKKNYKLIRFISNLKYIFISFSLIYLTKMFNYNFNIIISTLLNVLIYIFLIIINNVVETEKMESKKDKLLIKIFFISIFYCFKYYFSETTNDLFDNYLFISLSIIACLQMILDYIIYKEKYYNLNNSVNIIQTISLFISLIYLIIFDSFNVFSILIVYIISYIILIIYSIIKLNLFKPQEKEVRIIKEKNILIC